MKSSFLSRLKARLTRNKSIEDASKANDRVSEIIASAGAKIAAETDLRSIQTNLLARQLQFKKDAPIRAEVAKAERITFRSRIRRPQKSAVAHDVVSDHDGRLFLGMSNGQLLRIEKPHRNLTLRNLIHGRLTADAKAAGLTVSETIPAAA